MSRTGGRSLDMIEFVAAASSAPGLMEIADGLGLDKTTCSRLLAFLVERRWLERDEASRRYALGPVVIGLASSLLASRDVDLELMKIMRELRDQTDETVSMVRLFGRHLFCTLGIESTQVIRRAAAIGEALTLSGGPAGKSVLALLDAEQIDRELRQLDDAARALVDDQLRQVREHGYLAVINDRTAGVGALAAPIFNREGVYGSLSISGPADRWNVERQLMFVRPLLTTAATLTEILGGSSHRYASWLAHAD